MIKRRTCFLYGGPRIEFAERESGPLIFAKDRLEALPAPSRAPWGVQANGDGWAIREHVEGKYTRYPALWIGRREDAEMIVAMHNLCLEERGWGYSS